MRIRPWSAVAAACLGACVGGTETGNPAVPIQIALGLRSSEPTAVAVQNGDATTVLSEAWVAIGAPVFVDEGECGGEFQDVGKPGDTLLAADLARPDARIELDVTPKRYCGMWVPLQWHTPAGDLPKDAPADLADHSVVLKWTRSDGTVFTLEHPEQDEIEVVAKSGTFDVSDSGPRLLLAFDVAVWMRGIDLDAAKVNADGEIHIDDVENAALHTIFDANHECSLELYRDENENGRLDEGSDPLVGRCAPR